MRHALSAAILNIFLPALSFALVIVAPFDRNFVLIPLVGLAVMIVCMATAFAMYGLVPSLRNMPRSSFGVMIMAAVFGNVTFLGLPLINETLGPQYGYTVIVYDLLASSPLVFTAGIFIAARYGSGKEVSIGSSIKRVFTLPPLWGLVAGIIVHLSGMTPPQLVMDTAMLMGRAVIPIMIFTVGLALDFRDMRRLPSVLPVVGIKMLVGPCVAWWVGSHLGLGLTTLKAVVVIAAMPVMVISLIIADEFELDVPLTALCIAVSTVALFATLPLLEAMFF